MKQTIIHNGYHPRSNNDLMHAQEGMIQAIQELTKGLIASGSNIPNCILYGVEFTTYIGTSIVDITAGAVVLNGEICIYDGVVGIDLDVAPSTMMFSPLDTYPADNPVGYGDLTLKNVHLNRKAQLIPVLGAPANNQIHVGQAKRFLDLIRTNLYNQKWKYVGSLGEPVVYLNGFINGYQANGPVDALRYRKGANECVYIQGAIDYTPLQSVATTFDYLDICTLPLLHRPDKITYKDLQVNTPAGYYGLRLKVALNGNLSVAISSIPVGASIADISAGSPFGEDFEIVYSTLQ